MNRTVIEISELGISDELIDVRSPSEYELDHIPGAKNFPVLNDEERHHVGWTYKNKSAFDAKKIGASIVAKNIAAHIEQSFIHKPKNWSPTIYCWRGGQRSGSMSIILRQIGWRAQQLHGGYKAFRKTVIDDTDRISDKLRFIVVCGMTGVGKTRVLESIHAHGGQILDLEDLANHRGSLLGQSPSGPQPSQKRFETQIWDRIRSVDTSKAVFVESESKKIGSLRIPEKLLTAIRSGECLNINASIKERVSRLRQDYEHYLLDPESLETDIVRLRERVGSQTIDQWVEMINQRDWNPFITELLTRYYDPLYGKAMRQNFKKLNTAKNFTLESTSDSNISDFSKQILTEFKTPNDNR